MKNFSNDLVEMTNDELMNVEGGYGPGHPIAQAQYVMDSISEFCQGFWDGIRGY